MYLRGPFINYSLNCFLRINFHLYTFNQAYRSLFYIFIKNQEEFHVIICTPSMWMKLHVHLFSATRDKPSLSQGGAKPGFSINCDSLILRYSSRYMKVHNCMTFCRAKMDFII